MTTAPQVMQAEEGWQEPLFPAQAPHMSTVFIVELGCLACGDSSELIVGCLAALPPFPARCARCRGSVLVVATATRIVRAAALIDWREGMPKRGRPLARPRIHQEEDV